MFNFLFKKNSIAKIARVMPKALIKAYEKQSTYSISEVSDVFNNKFRYPHNIEYAYAMFCSQADFDLEVINNKLPFNYSSLRKDVSKKCFSNWPRFNFDSLLAYSESTAGGTGGGDGGCGGE